jgi:hypothetical protein
MQIIITKNEKILDIKLHNCTNVPTYDKIFKMFDYFYDAPALLNIFQQFALSLLSVVI